MRPINTLIDSAKELKRTRALVQMAMLLALQVVLGLATSISLGPYIRISFGYLAVAAAGALFGPFIAMANNGLSDIIMFLIKPSGPYFFGFTLSAMLSGLTYGFAFYRKDIRLKHILIARLIVGLVINIGLGTLWLSMLYGEAFSVLLPGRVLKNLLQYPVDVVLLLPLIDRVKKGH